MACMVECIGVSLGTQKGTLQTVLFGQRFGRGGGNIFGGRFGSVTSQNSIFLDPMGSPTVGEGLVKHLKIIM
jgi:hypothetical protein